MASAGIAAPVKLDTATLVVPGTTPREQHVHVKKLNVWQLTGICFFAVAGGPFGFEEAISSAGATWSYVGLVIVPIIWSIPIALMTAELATLIPDIGGQITWVERGLGPTAGFANSMLCLLTTFSDNALYPVVFLDYLSKLIGENTLSTGVLWAIKVVLVALCAMLNIRGVDVLGDATVSFGIIVMLPFTIMAVLGFFHSSAGQPTTPEPVSWGAFLSTIMWCTSGFDSAGTCSADVDNFGVTFPRAVAMSVVLVIATYIVPMPAAVKVIPDAAMWSDGAWSTAADILSGGRWLGAWIAVAAMVSNFGILSTMFCTTSRQLVGIAENGHLPYSNILSREHPVWETPYIMITINAAISLCFTSLDFGGLAQVTTVFYSTSTILRFISLWNLRRTEPDSDRPFKVPGGHVGMAFVCIPPIALSLFASSQCDWTELFVALSFLACVVGATAAYWALSMKKWPKMPASSTQGAGAYVTLEEMIGDDAGKFAAPTSIEIPMRDVRTAAEEGDNPEAALVRERVSTALTDPEVLSATSRRDGGSEASSPSADSPSKTAALRRGLSMSLRLSSGDHAPAFVSPVESPSGREPPLLPPGSLTSDRHV